MTSRILTRAVFGLALILLTASYSFEVPAAPHTLAKSQLRVSQHFAAGLEYLLVEPRELASDAELPMVILLHGLGDRPQPPARALLGADTPIRLIIPRGPLRHGRGFAWMPVSARHGESPALLGALRESTDRLALAIREWCGRYPTRGRPVVTGFSQGGILSATLAVTHPDSVGAAVPVAGWIPPSSLPRAGQLRGPPIHALHGSADTILSARRSRRDFTRLRRRGYPVIYEEFPGIGHEMHPTLGRRQRDLVRRALRVSLSRSSA